MSSEALRLKLAVFGAVGVCLVSAQGAAGQDYEIIPLHPVSQSFPWSEVADLNEYGHVCGTSYSVSEDDFVAVRWADSQTADIFHCCMESAYCINDVGCIAAHGQWDCGGIYLWCPGSGATSLPHTEYYGTSAFHSMNNASPPQIVGWAGFTCEYGNAAVWEVGCGGWELTNLGALATSDDECSAAYDINDSGVVVGYAPVYVEGDDWHNRPFVWRKEGGTWTATELGLLPYASDGSARFISNSGTVVGSVGTSAVRWEPDAYGGYLPPAELPYSCGFIDMNNRGDFLCHEGVLKAGTEYLAFEDLITDPGWTSLTPLAINDSGQIAGHGTYTGDWEGFLMSPCAEIDAAYSVLTHGAAGDFKLLLGPWDHVEPRKPGVLRLELEMSALMDQSTITGGNVQVTCENASYGGTISAHLEDATTVIVEFDPALPDEDCCRITFEGMLTLGNAGVCDAEVTDITRVRTLKGDIDLSGTVTPGDASIIKPHFGEPADQTHFLFDFDCSGMISPGDFSQVKPYFGNTAPWCFER